MAPSFLAIKVLALLGLDFGVFREPKNDFTVKPH
jgi:hypothetical protein